MPDTPNTVARTPSDADTPGDWAGSPGSPQGGGGPQDKVGSRNLRGGTVHLERLQHQVTAHYVFQVLVVVVVLFRYLGVRVVPPH